MATKKTTGKQLADMMYGNPEGAAFGVFPQAGKRGQAKPTAKQQLAEILSSDRAVPLPQFGDNDLSVPSASNRAMGQRMVERDVDLKRQSDQDMSRLEKLAGGMQTGRLIGSGLTQAVKSIPTAITKGGKAAEDYIAENIYKPNQPKAYEYAGDIGDFLTSLETDYKIPPIIPQVMGLESVVGPATRQAGRAVKQGAKQGALNLSAPSTLNPQAGVIKMKGGNFLTGSVEGALKPLKRGEAATPQEVAESRAYLDNARATWGPESQRQVDQMEREFQLLRANDALNKWVDSNLTNYVKKEMATPEDPVRRLAEEGVTHMPQNEIDYANQWIPEDLALSRMNAGFPTEGLGQSNTAKGWEAISDSYINSAPASEYTKPLTESEARRGFTSVVDDNSWLNKIDPNTQVQYLKNADTLAQDLGFDHIIDVLREDLASGRIRPEKLNTVSMEQAVRRAVEYDQELAAKMSAERAAKRDGLPVYKEYPEGYRWVELNRPGAFASESEAMGHSVRGYEPPVGHSDWVEGSGDRGSLSYGHGGWEAIKSGKAKVYSLVDSKGQPHTTVEVNRSKEPGWQEAKQAGGDPVAIQNEAKRRTGLDPDSPDDNREIVKNWDGDTRYAKQQELNRHFADIYREQFGDPPSQITQIKGKQNEAPNESYLPYVQDFVKSGQWSDVGDLQNTGLYKMREGKYGTQQELDVELKPRMESALKFLNENELFKEQHAARQRRDAELFELPYEEQQRLENIYGTPLFPGSHYSANELSRYIADPGENISRMDEYYPNLSRWVEEVERAQQHYITPTSDGMARGGRVHISDNPDVMQLELAAGGAVRMQVGGLAKFGAKGAAKGAKEAALPLSLARVRPSMQEILEAAERVGKQQAGEFVRSPLLKDTTNLAGRSKKEVERLKKMDYKVTPIKDLPEMKPYEAKVGEVNIALPGDQTISDMLIESVDGMPIGVTSEGGANFGRGRLSDPEESRAFWASNIGPAGAFQRKVAEIARLYDTDMVTAYHLAMGQTSNNFAQHLAEASMKAIDYSKLDKAKMNRFDAEIAAGTFKRDKKTGEKIYTTFSEWPGIANPEESLEAMKQNPELRKWFNDRMKTVKSTKPSDLPNAKSIEYAMTEPDIRDLEINMTGLSAGRMKPGAELIPDSAHQTYSHDIPGTALGRAPELSPFSISFPDATAFVRENYRAPDFTGTIQKVFPHQVVDEAYLEDMYKYYTQLRKVRGYKKGGAVQSYAEGGEITADDLILEERKL